MQPVRDQFGFITKSIGSHTPDLASYYRIEWSNKVDFINSTWYDVRMLKEDMNTLTCYENCSSTIGLEVQRLIVGSGNGEILNGGEFALVYVGEQTNHITLNIQHGMTNVTVISFTQPYQLHDFLRIDGDVFQIQFIDVNGNILLNEPYMGSYNGNILAYHAPAPTSCIPYDASYITIKAYLENIFNPIYPLYPDKFHVSRETHTLSYEW